MEDLSLNAIADDIGKIYQKHGRKKVLNFLRGKMNNNNREIPPTGKMRALYNFYRALYPANVPISYSFLRLDTLLGNTQEIKFTVNESNAGTTLPTERRLSLNDTFEVVDISTMLYTVPSTAAGNGVPTKKLQTCRMYTYPNSFVFNDSANDESRNLESIFNSGKVVFKLGNQILYDGIDCLRFLRVPTSQEGTVSAAFINSGGVNTVYRIDRDGYSSAAYSFDDNVPALTLSGNGKNAYSIQLPESINLSPVAVNRSNYATLWIRGFQCQNGTMQDNKKMA